jgi:membrane-associated phospholipid phosphatase
VSRSAVIVTLILTLACALAFAVAPALDLEAAYFFYVEGHFAGAGLSARIFRNVLYFLPSTVLVTTAVLYVARRAGLDLPGWARPSGRSLAFLALSMALGPGLLVNVILKDHWHRPRPVQTIQFGGELTFRPWYRVDGGCARNCSFVSGETSAAAWLIGAASLAPPPLRLPAMGVAVAITVATGITRMAFGGHYLSDVTFAALFTLLMSQWLGWLLLRRTKSAGDGPVMRRGLRGGIPPL